jgi:hypothetical protein
VAAHSAETRDAPAIDVVVDRAFPHALVDDVLGPDPDVAFAAADRLAA